MWESSKAQNRVDKSGKVSVAGKQEEREREWREMDLRGAKGQIDHGLDAHGKDFNFILSEMGNDGRILHGRVLCELCIFKESTLAAVYSRLEEEGEASGVWTQGVYIQ